VRRLPEPLDDPMVFLFALFAICATVAFVAYEIGGVPV
jgi:hypothetical protein